MSQMCPNCSFDNLDEDVVCKQCATPLRNLLGANTMLSQRYKLVSVLGCGAMGAVYLAQDQRLTGRRCAIKENRPDPYAPVNVQELTREQFLAEARVLARLDHPNLPKVSDYFIENGREYLVMDYVEGEDLDSHMRRTRQPLDEAEVLVWTDQVLDALNYLHGQKPQPIIHRDIKPANLRIDLYNRVKLVDFGLVKLFDAANPETKAELRGVGTPAYAPLEQFAGSEEHTDTRSDIYSLGATLYHLLTNIPPMEVHRRLLKPESLARPQTLNPQISANTEQVILKAMAIYPAQRYQSPAEMRRALSAKSGQEAGQSAAAIPMTLWAFGITGLIIVLLILGGLAYALFGLADAPASPTGSPATRSIAEQNVSLPTATPSPTSDMAGSTPTATLVVPAASPSPGAADFTLVETATVTLTRTVTATAAATTATPETLTPTVTASPTSTATVRASTIAFPVASLAGTIAYPVYNGDSYDLYFGEADGSGTRFYRPNASQPAFSPDGSRIAFHSWSLAERGLITMNLDGTNGFLISNFVEDQLPTWSADGSQITLLSRRSGTRKSEIIRVSSAVERGDSSVVGEGEYPTIGPNNQLVFKGWGNTGSGLRLGSYTMNNVEAITTNERDTAPAVSPDGRQIAFMSSREGNWDIYVIEADGSSLRRLTDDPARDGLPTWSPDGQVIAFVSDRGGSWAIWGVTPDGREQRQLFEMEGSPDGFVGSDSYASRGWAEERISWTN